MDRTRKNLKRKLTDRRSQSSANNEDITDASLEHSSEHETDPAVTQAGLVRFIYNF